MNPTPSTEPLASRDGNPFDGDDAAMVDAVIEHVNGNHADTVAFIAEFHPDLAPAMVVVDAEITSIDRRGTTLAVAGSGTHRRTLRLDFAAPIGGADQLQVSLLALVDAARQAAPHVPLTSIEDELTVSEQLDSYCGEVRRVTPLTANLVEVTVGIGVDGPAFAGGDEYAWVMIGAAADGVPEGYGLAEFEEQPDDGAVKGAYYTVRRHRPDANEIDLWVVLHGHADSCASRLGGARLGHRLALWGPRPGFKPPPDAASLLLVADETGFAAAAALIDASPVETEITAIFETVDHHHEVAFPAHPGLDLHWAYRSSNAATNPLLSAVAHHISTPPGAAFGAAESRQISAVRRHLRTEFGMPASHVRMTGYWRAEGAAGDAAVGR
jgi:NADPH-dependent ferric siderophore reductase